MASLDTKQKELFLAQIKRNFGLNLDGYKDSFLKTKIQNLWENHALENDNKPFRLSEEKLTDLKELLSVQMSEFFRDSPVFECLQEKVLPALKLAKENSRSKILRVWSAGCASGEEAYSLAILFDLVFQQDLDNFVFSITGTDINQKALLKAKKAVYHQKRTLNIPQHLFDKHFIVKSEKEVVLKEFAKKNVRLLLHDLLNDEFPTHFDLISFRNVGIYLSAETQEGLIARFHRSLNKDGFLILGKTETMPVNLMDRFEVVDLAERIYRKL